MTITERRVQEKRQGPVPPRPKGIKNRGVRRRSSARRDKGESADNPPALRHVSPEPPVSLDQKVRFLSDPRHYPGHPRSVIMRETHMSWVFLAGSRVYKLKKPVRFPYLDFSTPDRRAAACRAEDRLNRRLAPDVYLGVVPLVAGPLGLGIGGAGHVVDWLVVMRRLDDRGFLDAALRARALPSASLDRLSAALARFYAHATPVPVRSAAPALRRTWGLALAYNRHVLLDPGFPPPWRLPWGIVARIDRIQTRFLHRHFGAILARIRAGRIVDAHGDLRPEHIWLARDVTIIDCLEFDARLRALDPLDEIAFLQLECARLGAPWAGARIARRLKPVMQGRGTDALLLFYRSYRAMLRARLAIMHLRDARQRTPEKWPCQARAYLRLALADALRLQRLTRGDGGSFPIARSPFRSSPDDTHRNSDTGPARRTGRKTCRRYPAAAT